MFRKDTLKIFRASFRHGWRAEQSKEKFALYLAMHSVMPSRQWFYLHWESFGSIVKAS